MCHLRMKIVVILFKPDTPYLYFRSLFSNSVKGEFKSFNPLYPERYFSLRTEIMIKEDRIGVGKQSGIRLF